jgi:membrane-bound metal-dependent hydrolase YbcI (DUF457 family)
VPNTKLHTLIGAVAGAAYYVADLKLAGEDVSPDDACACFMLGGIAGSLPDVLEPPLHRKHRSFFHSLFTLGAGVYSFTKIDEREDLDGKQKTMMKAMLVAYLSHLLLDSRTPAGLPLLI